MRSKNIAIRAAILTAAFGATHARADNGPIETIKHMAGCFSVTFHYVEDGTHDKVYEPVLERADLVSQAPLVIKRSLILGNLVQPHWSEEWTQLADGEWQQKVDGPYGDHRYTCSGLWVQNQWSCTTPQAAKPRRDEDRPYDHLSRANTLQVNAERWVHVQTNHKLREDNSVYSVEIGWNTYERVKDARCEVTAVD